MVGIYLEFIFSLVLCTSSINSQEECQRGGCYPATGDLLVGRESKISATSTCGLNGRSKYCIVSFLDQSDKCFACDSRPEVDRYKYGGYSHLPKYMVTRQPTERLQGWWQAENGKQEVTIQVDLEAEFVFTHLIMTFKTFRPKAMYIERSWNYGQDWSVYRYFAYDCAKSFPNIPKGPQRKIDHIICEERYSKIEPSTEGEVVMKVLDPIIQQREDPYSFKVQSLLKLTNLRVRFIELHTFGDDVLGDSPEVNQKYYYALYEMVVRGSCSCYGHAEQCIPTEGTPANVNMVHGQCNCTHNTKGRNCEMCKEGYNDEPWRPAYKDQLNFCRKCNCHGHTAKCHFDPAVYNSTGGTSGGVCDDCQHNTAGRQCEQCKPLYYRNPFKSIYDTDVCKPCDCDPSGSFGGGQCHTVSDETSNSVVSNIAGRCICKSNVEGIRCDSCKDGFWNLLESNPEGCSTCSCNEKGTVGRGKCDRQTGTCRCKRYVSGLTCSKCLEGYWSLASIPEGCQECDCDIGGSKNPTCDDISGMCLCKTNLIGRQCNKVRPGHYFGNLDQVKSEGEDSIPALIGVPFRVIRKIVHNSEDRTWTGDGYVEVKEGSMVDFTMITVPNTGRYNIVIRYDKITSGDWTDVRVKVSKANRALLGGGGCDNIGSNEMYFYPLLPRDRKSVVIDRDMCFQNGENYVIQLHFSSDNDRDDGTTLVDSVVLIPKVNALDIFKGREGNQRKQLWETYNCELFYLKPSFNQDIPKICKDLMFSISAEINSGALPCNCDTVGTNSSGSSDIITCEEAGGQCPCKPGVVGRRCDRCAAGYFGFDNNGCTACDCDVTGSNNLFCHAQTGKCSCLRRIEGRKCNSCPPNHFGFPNCIACQCNEHSSTCDPISGKCTNCKDNTAGPSCNECAEGYYGDATSGTEKDCQKCQCPGGSSGNQFSNTCHIKSGKKVICNNCTEGYAGNHCEKCDDGYFGNPLVDNGSCIKCTCNGNVDAFADGKCDPTDGKCFNCTNHSTGDHCQECKQGYFGNARNQTCRACVCNRLGTRNSSKSTCDQVTGQCSCLKNVVGLECDQCEVGFYSLASGEGCTDCLCDKEGSLEDKCNQLDGQCRCREGYGGRKCSECEDFSWGDPKSDGCQVCGCNKVGSETLQCNRSTGICKCKENVLGDQCDMCAPRTSGIMPQCESCHTCNDQWEDIVNEIENKIKNLSKLSGNYTYNISDITAYTKEITNLTKLLELLDDNRQNISLTPEQVDNVRRMVLTSVRNIKLARASLESTATAVNKTIRRNHNASDALDDLERRLLALEKNGKQYRENMTKLVESNIGGALNSTRDSLKRSRAAQKSVDNSIGKYYQSQMLRSKLNEEIVTGQPTFEELDNGNKVLIRNLTSRYDDLWEKIQQLNNLLCGNNCGGCDHAQCSCSLNSTCQGAAKLSQNAVMKANEAKKAVLRKKETAEQMLQDVKTAELAVREATKAANRSYLKTMSAKEIGQQAVVSINQLIIEITEFLKEDFHHPNLTKALALETVNLNISLTPDEVKKLANQIRIAVNNLTDVDKILNETKKDLLTAIGLKEEALRAKRAAIEVMNKTISVVQKLNETMELQADTLENINIARADIKDVNAIIKKIREKAEIIEGDLEVADLDTAELEEENEIITSRFKNNEMNVEKAENELVKAKGLGERVTQANDQLQSSYNNAKLQLTEKVNLTRNVRERVQNMSNSAINLFEKTLVKLQKVKDLKLKYRLNEERALNLFDAIRRLEIEAKYINERLKAKSKCHGTCNPLITDGCKSSYDEVDKNEKADLDKLELEIQSRSQ